MCAVRIDFSLNLASLILQKPCTDLVPNIGMIVVGAHSLFYTPVEVDEFGFGEGLPTTMPAAPMAALPAPATV